jgi:hypothetical protein
VMAFVATLPGALVLAGDRIRRSRARRRADTGTDDGRVADVPVT